MMASETKDGEDGDATAFLDSNGLYTNALIWKLLLGKQLDILPSYDEVMKLKHSLNGKYLMHLLANYLANALEIPLEELIEHNIANETLYQCTLSSSVQPQIQSRSLISGEDLQLRCVVHGFDIKTVLEILGLKLKESGQTSEPDAVWHVLKGEKSRIWFKNYKPVKCPEEWHGSIDLCAERQLSDISTLADCPKIIHGDFCCAGCFITSLDGGPEIVEGVYDIRLNKLTSTDGIARHASKYLIASSGLAKNDVVEALESEYSAQKIDEGDIVAEGMKRKWSSFQAMMT